jgi:hypothetical protein
MWQFVVPNFELTVGSYDAADETEITIKEGERISHIEAESDEWWRGRNASGDVGLFPGMC